GMQRKRGHPARARERARARRRAEVGRGASGPQHRRRALRPRRQGHAHAADDAHRVARGRGAGGASMSGTAAGRVSAPSQRLAAAIRDARARSRVALVAFLTAGYPKRDRFRAHLAATAAAADVVEIGVPFTDPMADGVTIQRSSQAAIAQGVSLRWILAELAQMPRVKTPLLLMSYLNPLLAFGLDRLAEAAAGAGVAGFIVPDLPFDESSDLRRALDAYEIAMVQMVTPVTKPDRMRQVCAASQGFVYAVTMTGTTGKNVAVPTEVMGY